MVTNERRTDGVSPPLADEEMSEIHVTTWNIAAVNNNPFEYWVYHHDPNYNKLMADVQAVMDSPGEHDLEVGSILTDAMFCELKADML
eukprot:CAMPEP_0172166346 /NCGR_PEP_ID=MMETSP1050-20130122/8929_1 /TAXON_ID=233186 /ORGANISM="Cryptomonas curvata, Strain CCAP979/52" /LENGTH=87 /DNA_ID=CAMNT_0012836943 /DNA_START=478 /DNA_END=737 /DNA_ORIENTATION=-